MKQEIEWAVSLTRLKQEDKQRLLKLHRELFGVSMDFCLNCPEQIRTAVDRIKRYYDNLTG